MGIPDLCCGEGGVEDVLGLEGGGGPQALGVQEGERPFKGSCCHFVCQVSKTAESVRSESVSGGLVYCGLQLDNRQAK